MLRLLARAPIFVFLGMASLGMVTFALAQQASVPLSIVTQTLPPPLVHQPYRVELKATGGLPPLQWKLSRGNLPEGVELDSSTAVISGIPSKPGELELTISVVDSVGNTASRDYKIKVVAPLLIQWSTFPRVQGNQILGSVKVSNGTKDQFDLTVIVLGVNEYGRAFALGYQHFELQPETTDIEIPFGAEQNLPLGTYMVHADAVAEVASKGSIFRGRQQTPTPLRIAGP
ncbi:MAG TPA: Ig domain-containing protein [Terriglobales bacterium]|nr:Ig domain-containing protein [Terriglobales bacterium]